MPGTRGARPRGGRSAGKLVGPAQARIALPLRGSEEEEREVLHEVPPERESFAGHRRCSQNPPGGGRIITLAICGRISGRELSCEFTVLPELSSL